MSTDTSLVPIVSSQLAPITTDSEFMPPEWAHLVKSVQIDWHEVDVTEHWQRYPSYVPTGRCRIDIRMKLDYSVAKVIEGKLKNMDEVRGSGIIAHVRSMCVTAPLGTMDICLEGHRE